MILNVYNTQKNMQCAIKYLTRILQNSIICTKSIRPSPAVSQMTVWKTDICQPAESNQIEI